MKRVIEKVTSFLIVFPFVFAVIFFGYFPPKFDVILYTDNIKGEGKCSTYLSSTDDSFAYLYEGTAYFGSELKTLKLPGIRYNVDAVTLFIYDVESADILSIDTSIFGITINHVNKDGLTHPFVKSVSSAVTSQEGVLQHVDLPDPSAGITFSVEGIDFIPGWLWVCYFAFIVIISALLAIGLDIITKKYPTIRIFLLGAASLLSSLLFGAYFCGSFPYVNYTDFLLNWFLLLGVSLIINALTLPWLGSALISLLTIFWYAADYYVISFRGKPIMPADLKAAETAMEVINGYSITPTWKMLISIIAIFIYIALLIWAWKWSKKNLKNQSIQKKVILRGCLIAAAAIIMFFSVNNPAFRALNDFQWDAKVLEGFHREGIVLTFLNSLMSSRVDRPEKYSREIITDYLAEYEGQDVSKPEGIQPVNIIMVMNEAFADLRTNGLDENIDVMPFIDSLKENTIKGDLYISVLGGGTCNTEFEALTGNSLAFLCPGAYPYTENVTSEMFSLAAYLKKLGYETEAFHPNEPYNWNRNMVYPNLGFNSFHSIEDYQNALEEVPYLHSHPADTGDYSYIEKVSEEKTGRSRFLFDVTMQNHSGYDHFEDVTEDETVKEYGSDLPLDARVYLSLIKASDDAVKQLVETYQNSNEPTMIIFFGDHEPGLSVDAQKQINLDVNLNLDFYRTKFFIWTNYASESKENELISANYLPWLILKQGNFPMNPYLQMLEELHGKYPVISSQGVVDADTNVYGNVEEVLDDPLMQKYQNIQYANLFDEIDPAWFEVK